MHRRTVLNNIFNEKSKKFNSDVIMVLRKYGRKVWGTGRRLRSFVKLFESLVDRRVWNCFWNKIELPRWPNTFEYNNKKRIVNCTTGPSVVRIRKYAIIILRTYLYIFCTCIRTIFLIIEYSRENEKSISVEICYPCRIRRFNTYFETSMTQQTSFDSVNVPYIDTTLFVTVYWFLFFSAIHRIRTIRLTQ